MVTQEKREKRNIMKQQILFVDDELNILKGLQRSLRPLRNQWAMTFVEGGVRALECLEQASFDVIITDMRMPHMDGAQLLRKVQAKYPMMVRIILSGHSDQEMVMKSVKSAHQYLSKPCEKQVLIDAVTRACFLRNTLNQKSLQYVVSGIGVMPILPALYSQMMAELNSKDASGASVGEIISKDIGMTAKVLQLVNSSFFGIPRHVSTPMEAVIFLGIDVVKTLVLSIEVFSAFQKRTLSILPVSKIYDHCLRTGVIAKKIAVLEKMDKEESDNAMIAGILHDLGRLLLAENFPDEYQEVMEMVKQDKKGVHVAELEIMGVTHAHIGAYLLGLWGLPDNIVEGVAFHHSPSAGIVKSFDLYGLVHVANLMEHQEQLPNGWHHLVGVDKDYLDQYDLAKKIPLWRDSLGKK
jgi:putative nucleotidyltransferase with HDIG domain